MTNPSTANLVGALSALLALAGATGITAENVQGFFVVGGALVSFVSFIWSHLAHKAMVAGIRAGRIYPGM